MPREAEGNTYKIRKSLSAPVSLTEIERAASLLGLTLVKIERVERSVDHGKWGGGVDRWEEYEITFVDQYGEVEVIERSSI